MEVARPHHLASAGGIQFVEFLSEALEFRGHRKPVKPLIRERGRTEARTGNCPGDCADRIRVTTLVDRVHDSRLGVVRSQCMVKSGLEGM